jgi:hypothetical protein
MKHGTKCGIRDTAEPLVLAPDCLACFVDDTGHERLKGQPLYGLGGCAVLGRDYERVLVEPWSWRRAATTGNFNSPLHGAEFGLHATPANVAAMGRFFARQPFFRFAAVSTVNTEYLRDHEPMSCLLSALKARIANIFSRTTANSVALIFESSNRADGLLKKYFGALELERDGQRIPVEHCLMSKNAASHGLEVADFVMHAVGRAVRQWLARSQDCPRDFDAVFRRCDPRLVSFMLVDRFERPLSGDADVAIGAGLDF